MKAWGIIAAVLVTIVLLFVGVNSLAQRTSCWWYGKQTERQVSYAPFVGCMVEIDGKKFPRNELRVAQ